MINEYNIFSLASTRVFSTLALYGIEKLIVCLKILNLKQDIFPGFLKNPKFETYDSIACQTKFVPLMALKDFYQILGLILPQKHFFYFHKTF